MNRKLFFIVLAVLMLVLTTSVFTVHSFADFGEYVSDNDFGGPDNGSESESFGFFDIIGLLSWFRNSGLLIPAIIIIVIVVVAAFAVR